MSKGATVLSTNGERIALKFDERGLIPAVVQDARSREVLMVAWMNARSLQLTQETGQTHFWSRSRQELWHKGATSGNVQQVQEIRVDCDADTLLVLIKPQGPACHTGEQSCFYRTVEELAADAPCRGNCGKSNRNKYATSRYDYQVVGNT
jgi:phosphoribosyl-AMP cyclohydrolase